MPFLPAVGQRPAPVSSGGNYFKPQDGKNKVRILSEAVIGYSYWNLDNKPVRLREYPDTRPTDIRLKDDGSGKTEPVKLFWAMVVWDYATESLRIWEVTQASIQEQIEALYDNEDWGDPVGYDLTINRAGKQLDTTYTVQPSPQKAVSGKILSAYRDAKINLDALFAGGNPFDGGTSTPTAKEDRHGILKKALDAKNLKWGDVADSLKALKVKSVNELSDLDFDTFVEMIDAMEAQPAPNFDDIPF